MAKFRKNYGIEPVFLKAIKFMILQLSPEISKQLESNQDVFQQIMSLSGEAIRSVKNRETLLFTLANKQYYIKRHHGISIKEFIKHLIHFQWPIYSAENEWRAIMHLHSHQVAAPKIAGFGKRGKNPLTMQSFIITEALTNTINLHDLTVSWPQQAPAFSRKIALINTLAASVKGMHCNGINHRDCYLLHFLLTQATNPESLKIDNLVISVIDLHRAQRRRKTPQRWLIKDLSGLYFSSKISGLSIRDYYRFIQAYTGKSIKTELRTNKGFWQKIQRKGEKLYRTKPIV